MSLPLVLVGFGDGTSNFVACVSYLVAGAGGVLVAHAGRNIYGYWLLRSPKKQDSSRELFKPSREGTFDKPLVASDAQKTCAGNVVVARKGL